MKAVTDVIYPLLNERINTAIEVCRQTGRNGAFELPLLFENGFTGHFDAVLAIWCPSELRKQRLKGRNFSPHEVDKRDRRQLDPDKKLEMADYAVINNGTLDNLTDQLKLLVSSFN
jgi:dephospho-CoA kinase